MCLQQAITYIDQQLGPADAHPPLPRPRHMVSALDSFTMRAIIKLSALNGPSVNLWT
jgi:hypothetical protein